MFITELANVLWEVKTKLLLNNCTYSDSVGVFLAFFGYKFCLLTSASGGHCLFMFLEVPILDIMLISAELQLPDHRYISCLFRVGAIVFSQR